MRTVAVDGDRYLLCKRSEESSLVRDPETGEERYVENDRLTAVEGESPLALAARAVDEATRRALPAPDERGVGLLVELDRRGPTAVRDLLAEYDLCESDLHGLLAEFRAAGLVRGTEVAGRRGYELTEAARERL